MATTPEEKLEASFALYKGKDGKLTSANLGKSLQSCGANPSPEEISKLPDGSDMAKLKELVAAQTAKDQAAELRDAFKMVDKQNNGFITKTELKHWLTNLGDAMTAAELDSIIQDVDVKGDGNITMQDFINVLTAK